MAASGKKMLESKEQVVHTEGVQHPLFTGNFGGEKGLTHLITEYCGFAHSTAWHSFFGSSSLKENILLLARYATPLETVEAHVREAHKKENLFDTLVQASIQAIHDGDVNLVNDKNKVICEGMAERLMALCEELYQDRFAECLKRVKAGIPAESKTEQEDRERLNRNTIKQLFDVIKANDKPKADKAIKDFKDWAKTTSLINRIHLIYLARHQQYQ